VSDPNATVFELNATPSGPPFGSLTLNLHSGELTANWTANGTAIAVAGQVRCVESMSSPPTDRFLFVIEEPASGFYVLSTTNI
jgi:hypothetical protein